VIHFSHIKCDDCGERHTPGNRDECIEVLKACLTEADGIATQLQADLRAANEAKERAEAELASATDLANSWARESSVAESRDIYGLRDLIDRLWGNLSGKYFKAVGELAEARRELREAREDTRRLKALCELLLTDKWQRIADNIGITKDGFDLDDFRAAIDAAQEGPKV
jgi:hypothetical protein